MGMANIKRYQLIEKAIRKAGVENIKTYMLKNGHRIDKFDRDIAIIKYCLQHGPTATSKIFHLSLSYPSYIVRRYYKFALETIEEMEKERR